jgi:O-antigen ligase
VTVRTRVADRPSPVAPDVRSGERRRLPSLAVAAGAFLAVTLIAGASGGYYPDAWGWLVLAFGWAASLALLLRERVSLGWFDLAACGALALLTGWIGLSIAWSDDVPQSVFELQRALVYMVGLVAAVVVVRRRWLPFFLGGLLAGITTACTAGLLTRFFPSQGVGSDVIMLNRLSEPIGYWNALGIFSVMGALLALGFVAHRRRVVTRVAAAGALPLLITTLYFTYSRGAWIAFAIGLVAAIAVDPRRLRLVTIALLLAPASAAAVLVSAESNALTHLQAPHDLIVEDGRRVALVLAGLVVLSAATAVLTGLAAARWRPSAATRRAYGAALACVTAVGLAVVLVRFDGPVAMAEDAYRSFTDQNPAPRSATALNDLNRRLFTLRGYGRIDFWEASWHQNQARPVLGAGAGAFEQYWLRERPFPSQIRDAHGLYAEAVGELGFIGLGLLLLALGLPLLAGIRARHDVLVPGSLGAFTAFVAHAGVDWDWEVPVVTLVALSCAAGLLVCDRARTRGPLAVPFGVRAAAVAALVVIGGFSAVGLVGNRALGRAEAAANAARWQDAERESRTATRWAPWAAAGWQHWGRAQLGLGRARQARATLLEAVRKDPSDWRIWYDLGTVSRGQERLRAYRRAAQLNPFAEDVRVLRERGYDLPAPPEPTR